VNHARRDLCGGHPAMDVPTAIGTRYNFVRLLWRFQADLVLPTDKRD
jgi:hypothetical protein